MSPTAFGWAAFGMSPEIDTATAHGAEQVGC